MSRTNSSKKDEYYFFQLRKERPDKLYVSKDFPQIGYRYIPGRTKRYIKKVTKIQEDSEFVHINGEIILNASLQGAVQTRVTVYTYGENKMMSFTLQKFREDRNGTVKPWKESNFSFSKKEWFELLKFLDDVSFLDLSNEANFSKVEFRKGEKVTVRMSDDLDKEEGDEIPRQLVDSLSQLSESERSHLLDLFNSSKSFSKSELDLLSGRIDGLDEFKLLLNKNITENEWQKFFEKESWIFGYGLDYRFYQILQREASMSDQNLDGKESVVADYLLGDDRFTTIVELKRPDTKLFSSKKNRSKSWKLSNELTDAVSQILAQKAEWQLKSITDQYDENGNKIEQETFDPKAILIFGSSTQFDGNDYESTVKRKTFELFRRNMRNIDIYTFDELYERAKFIVKSPGTNSSNENKMNMFNDSPSDDDLPF